MRGDTAWKGEGRRAKSKYKQGDAFPIPFVPLFQKRPKFDVYLFFLLDPDKEQVE